MTENVLENSGKNSNSLWKSSLGPKIIFVVLGLVVAVEMILAARSLTTATVPSSVSVAAKTAMILVSSKSQYKTGDSIPVTVMIDTASYKASGADAILHFDPKILESSSSAISTGSIFGEYPALTVDGKAGMVTISGISLSPKADFQGAGSLATVNFQAKTAGTTTVSLEFTPGTKGSTIVDSATLKNVLEKVENLTLVIK